MSSNLLKLRNIDFKTSLFFFYLTTAANVAANNITASQQYRHESVNLFLVRRDQLGVLGRQPLHSYWYLYIYWLTFQSQRSPNPQMWGSLVKNAKFKTRCYGSGFSNSMAYSFPHLKSWFSPRDKLQFCSRHFVFGSPFN